MRNGAADHRRRTRIAAVVEAVLTGAYIVAGVLDSAPVAHHLASGSPPPQGLIGMGVLVLSPIVLGVLLLTSRRAVRVEVQRHPQPRVQRRPGRPRRDMRQRPLPGRPERLGRGSCHAPIRRSGAGARIRITRGPSWRHLGQNVMSLPFRAAGR
jgi:hypothetical protein